MTLLSLLGRIMRYFLLRPETLFLLCISLALWSYFFHTDEVKTIVKSSRDAVKMVKGKVAEMMQNERFGGLDVLDAEFSKTWEFKSKNVAVYSIQGRRDHMEDRFEVLTDIVNKTHPSIFGVFDGHGGEVSVPCSFRRLKKDRCLLIEVSSLLSFLSTPAGTERSRAAEVQRDHVEDAPSGLNLTFKQFP